jgi:hypothetical protein
MPFSFARLAILLSALFLCPTTTGAQPYPIQPCDDPCLEIYRYDLGEIRIEETFFAVPLIHTQYALAFSFGICHDPARVSPIAVTPGVALGSLDAQGLLDFLDIQFSPTGLAMEAILCSSPCPPLTFANGIALMLIEYEALQVGPATLELCDTVQFPPDPPVPSVVTDATGTTPLNGYSLTVTILDFPPLLPPNPDYTLGFAPIDDGAPGSVRTAATILGTAPGSVPIAGWSFGICHDPQLVQVIGAEAGADLETMRLGQPVQFFAVDWDAEEGVHSGAVVCYTGCATVPVGAEVELLRSQYELIGAPGSSATLEYCNQVTIRNISVVTIVAMQGGIAAGATLEPASIAIVEGGSPLVEPGFLRGDANGSGDVNIADVVAIAMHLFQGAAGPACSDAADADDDGVLDLADVVTLAAALFGGGSQIADPFPACGADWTADSLLCETMCP